MIIFAKISIWKACENATRISKMMFWHEWGSTCFKIFFDIFEVITTVGCISVIEPQFFKKILLSFQQRKSEHIASQVNKTVYSFKFFISDWSPDSGLKSSSSLHQKSFEVILGHLRSDKVNQIFMNFES